MQGYADWKGRPESNKTLGLKRAQAVKRYLVESGVSETSIRIVSLGKEGMLCDGSGEECRKLNRRLHLELRRSGLPVIATAAAVLPAPTVGELLSPINTKTEAAAPSESTESDRTTPEFPSALH